MRRIKKSLMFFLYVMVVSFFLSVASVSAKKDMEVNVKIGNKSFDAVFFNTDTSKELFDKLPFKYKMTELNGNEKYKYLDYDLPADEKRVGKINAGDIMLYGSDCLVVFYESFETSYKYTAMGRIKDTNDLKEAAGPGSVTVSFSEKPPLKLNVASLTLKKGMKKRIKLTGAKKRKIKWLSSDKKVASVSNGKITAKTPGKAIITAGYNNKKYKCRIIVK